MGDYPDELRADFQQFYGLNIDEMGVRYSPAHAAVLAAQLPEGSRMHVAIDPEAAWTSDRALIAAMVNDLNWLVWSKTKDGSKNRNRPNTIGPGTEKPERRIKGISMTPDALVETIERIRKEAADG